MLARMNEIIEDERKMDAKKNNTGYTKIEGSWDVEPVDIRLQVMDYYKKGLQAVDMELNAFKSRFRLPSSTYYSHRNVIDPLMHMEICLSVGRRYSVPVRMKAEQLEGNSSSSSHTIDRKKETGWNQQNLISAIAEVGQAIQKPRNNHNSTEIWLKDVLTLQKSVINYRVDQTLVLVEEVEEVEEVNFKIIWNKEPHKSRKPQEFLFSPASQE